MRLKIPKIIPGNFKSVEQAVNKLAAHVLSTTASPTFASLTLTSSMTASNFVSSVAIGTSPYACTSTTVNTNLNADLWDGYQFADYLDQAVKQASTPTFAGLRIASNRIETTLTGSGSLQTSLRLRNLSNTVGSGARMSFRLRDSNNAIQTYGRLCVEVDDNTAGSVDGTMRLSVYENGSAVDYLVLNGNTGIISTPKTIQAEHFTSTDDITMQGHLFTLGDNTDTNILLTFNGLTNDASLTYKPATNDFDFGSSLITTTSNITANNYYIGSQLIHTGDADTYLAFIDNRHNFICGGIGIMDLLSGGGKVQGVFRVNNDLVDIDTEFSGNAAQGLFYLDAVLNTVRIGDGGTTNYLEVSVTGNTSLKGSAILDWSNVPSKPKIYSQATEPNIPNDTYCFWTDTDDSKYYLILDIAGVQKKVELI